jgi:hypothetical protein
MNWSPTLGVVLGTEDVIGSMMLLWATLCITTRAGITDPSARWALFRRVLYLSTSVALFSLGVHRLENTVVVPLHYFLEQSVILYCVTIFPLLRAWHMISQDTFDAWQGISESKRARLDKN